MTITSEAIKIDLRRDFPKALEREMQLIEDIGSCDYRTCVIGALMGPENVERLLTSPNSCLTIEELLAIGKITAPAEQHRDLRTLQVAFDSAIYRERFSELLHNMAAKYAGETK